MSSSSYELVLTSSPDGPIIAYDASTGVEVTRFPGTRSPRRGLTVAGNSFIAASHVSPDTAAVSIHLYNWHTSSVLHRFSVPEFVAPLAATPDGGYIFAGGQSGTIHCFSVPSGNMVKSFPAHTKPISCLQLSIDGSLVISGSDAGSIMVIPTFQIVESSDSNSSSKDLILQHWKKAHSDSVTALSTGIGLCNSMLVSSSLDSTCKFWNLLEGTLLRTVTFPCAINGLAMAIDFHHQTHTCSLQDQTGRFTKHQ
ncbi:protein ROOT INITIATION DEFECTIVE 3-like [Neltuma alba]|uniref:protein ROOT INITIATION DEFECTIVE 3-like n=1 Tax=Neltuma alba TaxID=207710 RepID=UPI0010A598BB|nr:protein ROOT INITIATION DEFECTIVE 3-like [Prosopis alba]